MSENWTEFAFEVACRDCDTAAAIAQMCVRGGIFIEDYSDFEQVTGAFAPDELVSDELLALAKNRDTAIIHIYISPEDSPSEALMFMEERLKASKIGYSVTTKSVAEEDWANNWKQYFKPLPIGEKLLIVPTWDNEIPPEFASRTPLVMDPGMAFGSGQHETTRLCLELIEKYIGPEDRVLDVGTGSGILAIGALLLGANEAVGIDIDPLAVKISRDNAAISGVSDRFNAYCEDLAGDIDGKFRIICANIVADVVLRLIPDTPRLLADGGRLILSGIIEERLDDVLAGLTENGYTAVECRRLKGWCALCAVRTAG